MTRKAKRRRGLPKGAHRVRIEVKPRRAKSEGRQYTRWVVTSDRHAFADVPHKQDALRLAVGRAKDIAARGGFASVRIHDRKGKFQSERTYPRSSDSCPPKG